MRFIKFMETNLSKKKKWILRIICICVLLQLPIFYFMDKFYYFNDKNIRYTIGTYYKDAFIINSSSSKEKGFIWAISPDNKTRRLAPDQRFYDFTHDVYMNTEVVDGLDPRNLIKSLKFMWHVLRQRNKN